MNPLQKAGLSPASATALLGASALAALALFNNKRARRAEQDNPPIGDFIEVDGVALHYVTRGQGRPLVLLHGNGVTSLDFMLSGLFERAASDYRVIAFDRPGFGFSSRPAGRIWTAKAQARLILRACEQLGVEKPIVLGHSWGACVAVAMGLIAPERIASLALVSGYYYPTSQFASPLLAAPALPVIGDVLRHTISPSVTRLLWPQLSAKIFSPQKPPARFKAFPMEIALRPSQIQAEAAESGLMIPDAIAMQSEYAGLNIPTVVIAGDSDHVVDTDKQSMRLHRDIPQSRLVLLRGLGHMAHYFAADRIVDTLAAPSLPTKAAVPAGDMTPEPTLM